LPLSILGFLDRLLVLFQKPSSGFRPVGLVERIILGARFKIPV
jgi:hypothetical protein